MDSPSTPSAPDPTETANAQGQANIDAARVTTALNRYDQWTPYGKLTWTNGGEGASFNQDAYNKAMAQYQTDLDAWNQAKTNYLTPKTNQYGGVADNYTGSSTPSAADIAAWEAQNARPDAPTVESFWTNYNPDKWTSKIELTPEVQALVDSQLKTSTGLSTAVDSALQGVLNTFGKQFGSSDSLHQVGDVNDKINTTAGLVTNMQDQVNAGKVAYGNNQQLSNDALGRLNEVYGTKFNLDGAPAMPKTDEAARKAVEDALYARSTARLDPRYTQAENAMQSQLAAQGITQGSEAYNRELQNFSQARNDAYSSAMNDAISGADDAMQKYFNMDLAARQQGVNEATLLRTMPAQEALAAAQLQQLQGNELRANANTQLSNVAAIPSIAASWQNLDAGERTRQLSEEQLIRQQILNELNALRTGSQVSMPSFSSQGGGGTVNAAPIAQSAYNSYQGDLNAYNTQVGSNNAMLGGLSTLGAAAIAAFF